MHLVQWILFLKKVLNWLLAPITLYNTTSTDKNYRKFQHKKKGFLNIR